MVIVHGMSPVVLVAAVVGLSSRPPQQCLVGTSFSLFPVSQQLHAGDLLLEKDVLHDQEIKAINVWDID